MSVRSDPPGGLYISQRHLLCCISLGVQKNIKTFSEPEPAPFAKTQREISKYFVSTTVIINIAVDIKSYELVFRNLLIEEDLISSFDDPAHPFFYPRCCKRVHYSLEITFFNIPFFPLENSAHKGIFI